MQHRTSVVRTRIRRRRPRHVLRVAGGVVAVLSGVFALSIVTLGVINLPAAGAQTIFRVGAPQPVAGAPSGGPAEAALRAAIAASGGRASVAVVDLGRQPARNLSVDADAPFTAASTYKLPALMATGEEIARGAWSPADSMCFQSSEQEEGWFTDYQDGECLPRQEVAERAGHYSDNTAGHMLVDAIGGTAALNAYAESRGATESAFYDPNQTTAADLAALMTSEAQGRAGGAAAQRWLYPILTHTTYENGIPAGVGSEATVVHKIGEVDDTTNDVALVTSPRASYVVAITSDHLGGDAGWSLVATLSRIVWTYETA